MRLIWLKATGLPNRKITAVFLIVMLVWGGMVCSVRRPFPGDGYDDGLYLTAAQSLEAGLGYRLIARVGQPVFRKYPPGISAITAAALFVSPGQASLQRDYIVSRGVMLCSAFAFAGACLLLGTAIGLKPWTRILLVFAIFFHPDFFALSLSLGSDIAFAALATTLMARWILRARSGGQGPDTFRTGVIDGLLASGAFVMRGNGIVLVAAALAAIVLLRPWRIKTLSGFAATCGLVIGLTTLLLVQQDGMRDPNHYSTELAAAYATAGNYSDLPMANARQISEVAAAGVLPAISWTKYGIRLVEAFPAASVVLQVCCAVIASIGFAVLVGKARLPLAIAIMFFGTLCVYVVWYYPFSTRFGLPLLPLYIAAVALGAEHILSRVIAMRRSVLQGVVPACTTALGLAIVLGVVVRASRNGGTAAVQGIAGQRDALKQIELNTPADAVIISDNPEMIYLNTGRQGISLLSDVQVISRLPPNWESMQPAISLTEGRPLYAYIAYKATSADRLAGLPTWFGESPFTFETVFWAADGAHWLVRFAGK